MSQLNLPPPPPRSVFVDSALLRATAQTYALLLPIGLVAAGARILGLLLRDALLQRFGLKVPHPSLLQGALGEAISFPLDIATGTVTAMLVLGALQQLDDNDPVTLQGAWARGSVPGWNLVWATTRYQLLSMLGILAFVVPGILYSTRRALYAPLMVLGGMDAPDAFAQSPEWLFGHKLRLASAVCAVAFLSVVLQWFFAHGPLEATAHWVLLPLVAPVYPLLDGIVYLQLRAHRGGTANAP
jgi:hypothetical protein